MCLPAATLALIGAGISAAGAVYGGFAMNAQAQAQAKMAEQNAQLEREAAQQEQQNTRDAALKHYREVAQLKGQQIVGAAANGAVGDFGTAADTLGDTEMLSREDTKRIYDQGNQRVRGHDIGASNYEGEASAQRARGSAAIVSSLFSAGSTVLGGASQYSRIRAEMGGDLLPSVKRAQFNNSAIF